MKKVLLTGAGGFIGRHCLPVLKATGYEIHSISSRENSNADSDVYRHVADLLDTNQVKNLLKQISPTHLLHLAWYSVPGKYWNASENLQWVRASLHLLQLFREGGGERVVMAGTCAEYDWTDGYCSEGTTKLAPATLYGTCKHALGSVLDAYARQTKLSSAWGRLFFLYGPHEPAERLVASAIRSILLEEPARCSHGQQIRDFLYVQDAADALVALLDSDVLGPVNIASGAPVAVLEVVQEIARQLDRPDLICPGALPAAENEPTLLLADVVRLRDEVGWSPRYDLASGLEETINWWRLPPQERGAGK